MSERLQILVVDHHPSGREGLSHRINAESDMTVCGTATCRDEALDALGKLSPTIVITEIALKESDGLDLVRATASRYPHVHTIVHSMYSDDVYADRSLRAGAKAYLNKTVDPSEVIRAIREVRKGHVYLSRATMTKLLSQKYRDVAEVGDPINSLSDRQLEVFRLIGDGIDANGIAERLHISVHTVETHRDNIKRKLDCSRVSDLTRFAVLWARENR